MVRCSSHSPLFFLLPFLWVCAAQFSMFVTESKLHRPAEGWGRSGRLSIVEACETVLYGVYSQPQISSGRRRSGSMEMCGEDDRRGAKTQAEAWLTPPTGQSAAVRVAQQGG
jgi:hypothetical protein